MTSPDKRGHQSLTYTTRPDSTFYYVLQLSITFPVNDLEVKPLKPLLFTMSASDSRVLQPDDEDISTELLQCVDRDELLVQLTPTAPDPPVVPLHD